MAENAVIKNLFEIIKTETGLLKEKQGIESQNYIRNIELQHIVERAFINAIQATIDTARRIISQKNFPAPDDYFGSFEILFQKKIIPWECLQKMKEMVGFRNALVHEYRLIRHEEVYRHLQESLGVFQDFLSCIVKFAEKEGF